MTWVGIDKDSKFPRRRTIDGRNNRKHGERGWASKRAGSTRSVIIIGTPLGLAATACANQRLVVWPFDDVPPTTQQTKKITKAQIAGSTGTKARLPFAFKRVGAQTAALHLAGLSRQRLVKSSTICAAVRAAIGCSILCASKGTHRRQYRSPRCHCSHCCRRCARWVLRPLVPP